MISTFKLINSYFWKTIYGPIISFIFPIILILIFGNIFKVQYVYPGIIAMSMLFIGLLSLPLSIMELKQSSLFKYIGSSPVNPIKFTIVIIGFYAFIAILSSFVILITTIIAFKSEVFPSDGFSYGILGGIFSLIGSLSFFTASSIHLLFVIMCGLIVSTISKTPQQSLTIGLIVLIPSIFLSGMVISVDIIAQSELLNWVSRFNPFRYSTGNMVIAATPKGQIGDMFQTLTLDQKNIIFAKNTIQKDGSLKFNIDNNDYIINSMKDIENFQKKFGSRMKTDDFLQDVHLYELTFEEAIKSKSMYSDNNIFNWLNSWSVRRVPATETVKRFVKDYFTKISSGKQDIGVALRPIGEQIVDNKFGWLEIFLKQTNVLYSSVERVLNFVIPLGISIYSIVYVSNNFKWSAR